MSRRIVSLHFASRGGTRDARLDASAFTEPRSQPPPPRKDVGQLATFQFNSPDVTRAESYDVRAPAKWFFRKLMMSSTVHPLVAFFNASSAVALVSVADIATRSSN